MRRMILPVNWTTGKNITSTKLIKKNNVERNKKFRGKYDIAYFKVKSFYQDGH